MLYVGRRVLIQMTFSCLSKRNVKQNVLTLNWVVCEPARRGHLTLQQGREMMDALSLTLRHYLEGYT